MQRKYYIYEHREADTGRVFYVGKGHANRAWYFHNRNNHWNNISKKHGVTVHIIYDNLDEKSAFEIETLIISAYGRENLCNLTDGGEGMSNPSDETRKKLSQSHIGIKKSDSERSSISARMRGANNIWFGKTFSDEHKMKLSIALSGRNLTKEHAAKIGYAVRKKDVMSFFNEITGDLFIGSRSEMKGFGLSNCEISMICRRKRRVAKGWTVYG